MERVLIDVTRLVDRALRGRLPTGVDRVSLAYLGHFYERARALVRFGGRWIELGEAESRRVFEALLHPGARSAQVLRLRVGRGYALRWRGDRGAEVLFNTGHSGLDQPGYADEVQRRRLKPVFFLHDLIPITHPEYCRAGEAQIHQRRLETMVGTGRGLVVNSQVTRIALENHARLHGWRLPRCVVAPLAPARLPPPGDVRLLPQPYFVILGTIEPRKNHLLLLHLWRELVDELGGAAPRLVVIGQRGWECEQVVDLLDRCMALRDVIVERPACNDNELSTWLHHARALLFPSFIEGFGMPLTEAMTLGVPVIASDLAVFHEVAGELPEYLEPLDGLGWKRMILDYMRSDSARHASQRARLNSYRAPTWDSHFAVVEALLNEIRA